MNDRFNFRAWDERNKIMHYDFQFIKDWSSGGWIIFQSDKQKLDWETNEKFTVNVYPNPYFAEQLKIMQSTGLKDKNGKLIYEGDFLKDDENLLYEVTFKLQEYATSFSLKRREIPDYYPHITTWCGLGYRNCNKYEAIGNIYENKELLE